jgi:hypothetical protein
MQRNALIITLLVGFLNLAGPLAFAEIGAATTVGPLVQIRSVANERLEYGGEAAQWLWKKGVPAMVGIDVGGSNRAVWLEAELGTQLEPTEFLGGIAGGVERRHSGGWDPQFTIWVTHLRFPLVPFARLSGLAENRRVWQGGLMFKLPVLFRL